MSRRRKRTFPWLFFFGASVFFSLRPAAPVDRLVAFAVAPLRVLGELASPLRLLRQPQVLATERHLAEIAPLEAEENLRFLIDLARSAEPSDPAVRAGRRLVHAEVLGRVSDKRDVLEVRVRDVRGVVPGLPVACGNAYVGRVLGVRPGAADRTGHAWVELVTARDFHVGARVVGGADGGDVLMTVGGVDSTTRGGARDDRRVRLVVHNPSDRQLAGGRAVVYESFREAERYWQLAEGLALGEVRRAEEGRDWTIEPELDYVDGLYDVVILCPEDPTLPDAEPFDPVLMDSDWVRAVPLGVGDASPWREAKKIRLGSVDGIEGGAAVTAIGARLLGRVTRVGLWSSDVSFLGDPGFSVVAVARFEGVPVPRVLGRLVSLGRDDEQGAILFHWVARVALGVEPTRPDGCRPARLYTGSGDPGLSSGFYLGEALIPVGDDAGQRRTIRLVADAEPRDVQSLFVRASQRAVEPFP